MDEIMQLVRSIVADTYPGIAGQQGRIITNDAPFVIPYFNSAFRWIQRKLRQEGASFPIVDNWILPGVTPVAVNTPTTQVNISFNGYFDGAVLNKQPRLPSDCQQLLEVWETGTGTNLPFQPMVQPQRGLQSRFPLQRQREWEWRQYQLNMIGATQSVDLRLRYQQGLPPLNVPAEDFAETTVNILDSQDVIANHIAMMYAQARGAQDVSVVKGARDEAMDDMANDWIRRSQAVVYRRQAYQTDASGGDSNLLGQTGVIS
jgi:hypothetical protein